jgi:hypothetical protein
MKSLNDLIAWHEAKIATLRQLANDPELSAEILSALASGSPPAITGHAHNKPATQLEKVEKLLSDGQWRTAAEIADSIRASKTSVAPLFCRNSDRFEKRMHPQLPGRVQWHLKTKELEDEKK